MSTAHQPVNGIGGDQGDAFRAVGIRRPGDDVGAHDLACGQNSQFVGGATLAGQHHVGLRYDADGVAGIIGDDDRMDMVVEY